MAVFPMDIFAVPLGLIILLLGRKLFWLFVAGIGFISGMHMAAGALMDQPGWIVFLIGLGLGCVGAIIAVFLQRFAVILSGFLAGGYLVSNLISLWGWPIGPFTGLAMILFGIIGAVAAYHFFDWALIVLSALTGAAVITGSLSPWAFSPTLLLVVLFVVGVAVQAGLLKRDRSRSSAPKTADA